VMPELVILSFSTFSDQSKKVFVSVIQQLLNEVEHDNEDLSSNKFVLCVITQTEGLIVLHTLANNCFIMCLKDEKDICTRQWGQFLEIMTWFFFRNISCFLS
jgi:hypothetical protein